MTNLAKIQKKLKTTEGVLLFGVFNRRYYTGLATSNGYVFITRNRAEFHTDFRYMTVANETVKDMPVVLIEKSAAEEAADFFNAEGICKIYVEGSTLTFAQTRSLEGRLPNCEFVDGDSLFASLRKVKSREEIACIRAAQKITDRAFSHICQYISRNKSRNLTEKKIAAELDSYMLRHGADAPAFSTIVASGENGACPHAVPSDRVVRAGDFITMDFGATYHGYCSDMTRTVAIGAISDKQRQVYDLVLEAQKRAMAAIHAGVRGCDVDAVARNYLEENGYGKAYFGHGLGHSLGLAIHEEPRFSPACTQEIPARVVISVEPGVYIPGEFGVRIEDIVLITKDGCKDLTTSEKSLIIL